MTGDQIIVEGMVFYGYHGVHPEERKLGQRFVVDLEITCNLQPAGRSDALDDTVSYSDLYRITREVVEGEPRALIEAVAESIASEILAAFPMVTAVTVAVWKPEAPIKGALRRAGVRIHRTRRAEG